LRETIKRINYLPDPSNGLARSQPKVQRNKAGPGKCCFYEQLHLTKETRALILEKAVLPSDSVINLGSCAFNF
jgi:hypothetical protein